MSRTDDFDNTMVLIGVALIIIRYDRASLVLRSRYQLTAVGCNVRLQRHPCLCCFQASLVTR